MSFEFVEERDCTQGACKVSNRESGQKPLTKERSAERAGQTRDTTLFSSMCRRRLIEALASPTANSSAAASTLDDGEGLEWRSFEEIHTTRKRVGAPTWPGAIYRIHLLRRNERANSVHGRIDRDATSAPDRFAPRRESPTLYGCSV